MLHGGRPGLLLLVLRGLWLVGCQPVPVLCLGPIRPVAPLLTPTVGGRRLLRRRCTGRRLLLLPWLVRAVLPARLLLLRLLGRLTPAVLL